MLSKSYYQRNNRTILSLVLWLLFLNGLLVHPINAQDEDFTLYKRWMKYTDISNVLYHHLTDQAFQLLDNRKVKISELNSVADWKQYQKSVNETLLKIVGPFPAKTPLNAKIISIIRKKGYRVEKIIFESQPQLYVTAALFIPNGIKGKIPAVIYCSGHSQEAFRGKAYQQTILNLVKKKFIVLAFDPIGQGERLQYYDSETKASRIGGPTLEHSYPGAQCFLIGSSVARYMIWDGIRTMDYLLTRKEVDPERIAITGRSGGGTQSAYIAAFDPRILVTAPECYICGFQRLLETIGPQDAEQNFYHGLANGIDHADLLEVRAPKPALMITTTRDFFSIQGARETACEIRKAYQALAQPENFQMVEDNAGHETTVKNREALYAFLQKHLNWPGNPKDEAVEFLTSAELQITPTGQLQTSYGNETIFSLNRREAEKLVTKLETSRQNLAEHLEKVKAAARTLSGFKVPAKKSTAVFAGRYLRSGYCIEKYFIEGEGNYPIPFLLFLPTGTTKWPAMLYINPAGKAAETAPGGEIESLVKKGQAVLTPDILGYGEVGPGAFTGDAYHFKIGKAPYNLWFGAIQIQRSLAGIHAGDMLRLVHYLKSREDIDPTQINVIARGELCSALLHAAVFEPVFKKIVLVEPLVSFKSLVMNQYYKPLYMPSTVAGAVGIYDLPELMALLTPHKLFLINPANQSGERINQEYIANELKIVYEQYSVQQAVESFVVKFENSQVNLNEILAY
ncbi:acetylxylan esterase [candidate division KSB1 bacterium]|nr:acetylxylan esterase [candidate division KSB1 bacterium]